jgi:hypothetical protein
MGVLDMNWSWIDKFFGQIMLVVSVMAFGLAWRFGFF